MIEPLSPEELEHLANINRARGIRGQDPLAVVFVDRILATVRAKDARIAELEAALRICREGVHLP